MSIEFIPTAVINRGIKCNAIQDALQKVDVDISFEQASIVFCELSKKLSISFRRRNNVKNPAKSKEV
jgi:hypothetical protein